MAIYIDDHQIIVGLAERHELALQRRDELVAFVGATHSRIVDEQRPPETAAEFIRWCASMAS
jgi:hypothetical protein